MGVSEEEAEAPEHFYTWWNHTKEDSLNGSYLVSFLSNEEAARGYAGIPSVLLSREQVASPLKSWLAQQLAACRDEGGEACTVVCMNTYPGSSTNPPTVEA